VPPPPGLVAPGRKRRRRGSVAVVTDESDRRLSGSCAAATSSGRSFRRSPYAGVRVGETAHPGPGSAAASESTAARVRALAS